MSVSFRPSTRSAGPSDILLPENVKVDGGVGRLEGDSEVTHFHGSDVVEEM